MTETAAAEDLLHDGRAAAAAAGLVYFSPDRSGIRRRRAGKGFTFRDPDGRPVKDAATLERIRALVIPPAWRDVWICPDPNGHIQAIGYDDAGRKQYRYHPEFRQRREEAKFHHIIAFAHGLPAIRAKVAAAMRKPGLGRDKVLATVVHLLEATMIRVGNREYARSHHSFGLTTLENEHVEAVGAARSGSNSPARAASPGALASATPRWRASSARARSSPVSTFSNTATKTARVHAVTSGDVNAWLREATGADITAKDFRTWAGTVLAARLLHEGQKPETAAALKRQLAAAVRDVSTKLGNTPAICRKGYIHPSVQSRWLTGDLDLTPHWPAEQIGEPHGLRAEEAAVLAFLEAVEASQTGAAGRAPLTAQQAA